MLHRFQYGVSPTTGMWAATIGEANSRDDKGNSAPSVARSEGSTLRASGSSPEDSRLSRDPSEKPPGPVGRKCFSYDLSVTDNTANPSSPNILWRKRAPSETPKPIA